jgi:hypothetical protein
VLDHFIASSLTPKKNPRPARAGDAQTPHTMSPTASSERGRTRAKIRPA